MMTNRRTGLCVCGLGALLLGFGLQARAEDAPALSGTWEWSWKDQGGNVHQHVLEIEGVSPKLAAREQFDALPPVRVTDWTLDGKKLRFTVVRGDRRADYSGVVADANTINGTVKVTSQAANDPSESHEFPWKAQRRLKPKLPPQPKPEKPEG